jgi:hypothetical protein
MVVSEEGREESMFLGWFFLVWQGSFSLIASLTA